MAIIREGQLLIITGNMGHGKSHWANVVTEICAKHGSDVYTNINYFKEENWEEAIAKKLLDGSVSYVNPPLNVHISNKMSDLLFGITKTSPNVVILDEAMIYAGYDRHGSKIQRWFKEFVTQCRKFDTAVILIIQVKRQLTKLLREQLEHWEHFCQKKNGNYIIRMYKFYPDEATDKGPVFYQTYKGHYPYDSKSPASLVMDVDMEGFLGDISAYDSIEIEDYAVETIKKWIIDVGPKKPKEKKEEKKSLKTEIIRLYKEGFKNSEIAGILKCSERYARLIVKEYKKVEGRK